MRYREDKPADLARARAAVRAWREEHPDGTPEQLLAAVGPGFHRDYGVVLRAMLYAADKHAARVVTGIITGTAGASR